MPQLALDQRQRDPLAQQLDSVSMPELMRGYAPADPGRDGCAMQLKASGAGRPDVPARRSGDHAEQWTDRQRHTLGHPRFKGRRAPRVHPDHSTPIVLAVPDQNRPPPLLQIGLGQRQRLVDAKPGPLEHHDQPVPAVAVRRASCHAHDRDDLIDCRRVSGLALPLVRRRPADVKLRQSRWRAATAGSVEQLHINDIAPSLGELDIDRPALTAQELFSARAVDRQDHDQHAATGSSPSSSQLRLLGAWHGYSAAGAPADAKALLGTASRSRR